MGMDQYLLIPFLGGWTSIYQLFGGSLGTRVLTHSHIWICLQMLADIWSKYSLVSADITQLFYIVSMLYFFVIEYLISIDLFWNDNSKITPFHHNHGCMAGLRLTAVAVVAAPLRSATKMSSMASLGSSQQEMGTKAIGNWEPIYVHISNANQWLCIRPWAEEELGFLSSVSLFFHFLVEKHSL